MTADADRAAGSAQSTGRGCSQMGAAAKPINKTMTRVRDHMKRQAQHALWGLVLHSASP